MRRSASSIALIAALVISCSSGTVQKEEPYAYSRARALNIRAAGFYDKGDYAQAAADFREAANIGRSLDDARLAGLNTINLAASLRASGSGAEAEKLLVRMLGEVYIGYSSADLSSANAILAAVRMELGRPEDAISSAKAALELCSDAGRCGFLSSARLVLAKLAFDSGSTHDAERHASAALADAHTAGNILDVANSLRMIARCRAAESDYRGAIDRLEEALGIDKKTGAAGKVALDLYELAMVYKLSGEIERAELYLRKALSSSLAGGSGQLSKEIENQLNSIAK